MNAKHSIAIIHGRFQPPHNGHLKYILTALEKAEHIFIGICTPEICSTEESAKSGYPCTKEHNPFTYLERIQMIHDMLKNAGASHYDYSFVPFPSNYENIHTIIPKATVFLMSVTSPHDEKKVEHIKSLGYKVEQIIEIPEMQERESGRKIRESRLKKDDVWKKMVPEAVSEYIEKNCN